MITITVTSPGAGNLVASATANTTTIGDLRQIGINNQTSDQIWICQVSLMSDAGALATSLYPPYYLCLASCPANESQTLSNAPANNKVYMGFTSGAQPDQQALEALFRDALASNDAWFLSPPAASPIVPLRVTGCVVVSLTPQTDPNPPHNVHPKLHTTVNFWDGNNALMWITNDSGRNVTFYIEIFHTALGPTTPPPTFLEFGLKARLSSYVFPFGQGGSTNLKAWYGFAFTGEYANAQAYFQAHPRNGGHHTGQIPPEGY